MKRREFLIGAGVVAVAAAGGCVGDARPAAPAAALEPAEQARLIAALKPPKRARPVVAVLGENAGSETTDFIVPWSVMKRSDVADVHTVATGAGPISLHPALKVEAETTTAGFDARYPGGADYVIVPAFHDFRAAPAVDWIKSQAANGATIVGVCAGALTLAHAGLLEGREGTTHWYSVKDLQAASPGMLWRKDRRYVADRGVVTTTGVSASLPVSLAIVEAMAGAAKARTLAMDLGVESYDASHASDDYALRSAFVARATLNTLGVLGHETLGLELRDGCDELAIAFQADAWSRTYRSKCVSVGQADRVVSANGLVFLPDRRTAGDARLLEPHAGPAGSALDGALAAIRKRYGRQTAAFVALQLEHPWPQA